MVKKTLFNEFVVSVDSLQEAHQVDIEEQDINLVIIGGQLTRKRNWQPANDQTQIPMAFLMDKANKGKIIIRVGLGYFFLLDVDTNTSIKVLDTDFEAMLNRFLDV